MGALYGSAVPGAGTLVGAAAGLILGIVYGDDINDLVVKGIDEPK